MKQETGLPTWTQFFFFAECHTMGLPINQDYHLYNLLFCGRPSDSIIAQDTEDAEYMLRKLVEE
jgi:hypothetical protein